MSATPAANSPTPEITSQGFDINVAQDGLLGSFGRVRVRFEVPERIEDLYVSERSYDVDLAKTPEMAHLPLFGLKTQVRQLTDVTLDFQNYINTKLDEEGTYTFDLRVTDRKGKSASARLLVRVAAPPGADKASQEPMKTAPFRFVRVGASAVSGADAFGVTWKTIKNDGVIIRITGQTDRAIRLIEMAPSDYDEVRSRKQLDQKIASYPETSTLQLKTADGQGAGLVFCVINQYEVYLLKVTGSDASLSEAGTTVTLAGEYKH
jgi:hypothetical protein